MTRLLTDLRALFRLLGLDSCDAVLLIDDGQESRFGAEDDIVSMSGSPLPCRWLLVRVEDGAEMTIKTVKVDG